MVCAANKSAIAFVPPAGFWTHWKRDSTEVLELMKRNGRHIYELFSIMVHQGSASGGHYYCYIKSVF
jgi:ubiquitin C-terminal hydrolase